MPGSIKICDFGIPARSARAIAARRPATTSRITSDANGPLCIGAGMPRMCMSISATRLRRTTSAKLRVEAQGADVVNDCGARGDSRFGDVSLLRIQRNGDAYLAAQAVEHRQHAR